MKLFVFKRPDGTYWAEYSEKVAKEKGIVVDFHEAATRHDYEQLIAGTYQHAQERIRALAERALDEYLATIKNVQPTPPPIVPIHTRSEPIKKQKRRWYEVFPWLTA